jgi:hypothetical protein
MRGSPSSLDFGRTLWDMQAHMKRAFLMFIPILALTLSAAHADSTSPASPTSLKDNMKHIKQLFKGISATVSNPSKNAQNAADAASIANLFAAVEDQVPDSISSLPADEQTAALADYKSMIHHEVDLATSLEKALETNDNATAASILQQMDSLRKDGHQKYAD